MRREGRQREINEEKKRERLSPLPHSLVDVVVVVVVVVVFVFVVVFFFFSFCSHLFALSPRSEHQKQAVISTEHLDITNAGFFVLLGSFVVGGSNN